MMNGIGDRIRRRRMIRPGSQIQMCPRRLHLISRQPPEEDLNENVTYHYKYTRSREAGGNAADSDNGNYYASHNYGGE